MAMVLTVLNQLSTAEFRNQQLILGIVLLFQIKMFLPGFEPGGPSVCETDVITTTPQKHIISMFSEKTISKPKPFSTVNLDIKIELNVGCFDTVTHD